MTKGVDERIDKVVFRCFGHVDWMEKDMIAKRLFIRVCAGTRSVGRPRKRWVDTVNDC